MVVSLIRSEEECVKDYWKGVQAVHPGLLVDTESGIVLLNRERHHRVALVAGCGSGHEPFAVGYVGENMLTAYVGGKLFSGGLGADIDTALVNLAKLNQGGILAVVPNYVSSALNFGLAIETVRGKGIQVETVLVADDVAHLNSEVITGFVGRRALCGAILMFKILGALSTAGRSLKEMVLEARCINCRMSTLGFSLKPCTLPGSNNFAWEAEDDTIELGVGIHGEAGIGKIKSASLTDLVRVVLAEIMRIFVAEPEDNLVILVNNLGSCTDLETYSLTYEILNQIKAKGFNVVRTYVGRFMTTLDCRGAQVTLFNVTGRDDWIKFLDLETEAFAWPVTRLSRINEKFPMRLKALVVDRKLPEVDGMLLTEREGNIFKSCILAVCRALRSEEARLNQLDTDCGDGDCGTHLRCFADGVQNEIGNIPLRRLAMAFLIMSRIAEEQMGGTSGALYSLLLLGASRNASDWESAWVGGIELLKKYTIAELGYRTLLDALIPACLGYMAYIKDNTDRNWEKALNFALDEAIEGCGKTATMKPKVGKALYADPEKIKDVDSGAYAVVVWLSAIYKNLVVQEGEDKQCPI